MYYTARLRISGVSPVDAPSFIDDLQDEISQHGGIQFRSIEMEGSDYILELSADGLDQPTVSEQLRNETVEMLDAFLTVPGFTVVTM